MKRKRIKDGVEKSLIVFFGIIMAIYCISLLIPIVWMLSSSLKSEIDYALSSFRLPKTLEWSNYVKVFDYLHVPVSTSRGTVIYDFLSLAAFSLTRSTCIPLLVTFVQACCAYVLAKYKFVGNQFIYVLGIFVMITPIVGNLPSAMAVNKALGVYNNLFLNILTAPSCIFGLNFLILYAAFKGIPWEYAEAAFIDGAGHYTIMLRIMLPMVLPTCAVLFVLSFLGIWNDYTASLIWLPSYPNLAFGLYMFQQGATAGSEGASAPVILAGFAVVMIPTIILYLASQKLILAKFNVGGLK